MTSGSSWSGSDSASFAYRLEVLCVRLIAAGMTWQAVEAGLAAVAAESLRESGDGLVTMA